MERITSDEVRHLSVMARVGMTDDEIDLMRDALSHILDNIDILNQVDAGSLADALNRWLLAHRDLLPKSLALDGKDLGGGKLGAIVTLCHQHSGQPLAMRTYSGAKDDCELPVGRRLLEEVGSTGVLENAVVTGDALHTQKKRL